MSHETGTFTSVICVAPQWNCTLAGFFVWNQNVNPRSFNIENDGWDDDFRDQHGDLCIRRRFGLAKLGLVELNLA